MNQILPFGILMLSAAQAFAIGAIQYTSDSRYASAHASPDTSDSRTSPWLEDFSASVSAYSPYGTGAFASQRSRLHSERMFVSGYSYAHGGMQFYSGSASSFFDVAFTVVDATPAKFWGGVGLSDSSWGTTISVKFTGPSGIVFETETAPVWDFDLMLVPGSYRLRATGSASAAGGPQSTSGSFYAGLAIPSPATPAVLIAAVCAAARRRRGTVDRVTR